MELRTAYLHLRLKDKASAKSGFEKVVSGKVTASKGVVFESAERPARIAHGEQDKEKAYLYFSFLHNASEPKSNGRAKFAKDLAGLLFEFARENIGTFEDFRSLIKIATAEAAGTEFSTRATMELMYAESYYYQSDHEAAASDVGQFIDKYKAVDKAPWRGIATAAIFRGLSLIELGKDAEERAVMESVLEMPLKKGDGWGSIPDLKAYSLK